jgi:lipoprotein-anchoring transpeptidase ErfK/SrfK
MFRAPNLCLNTLPMLLTRSLFAIFAVLTLSISAAKAVDEAPKADRVEIVVSIAEQKLVLKKNGEVIRRYPVSTSRFGVGDAYGTYRTPIGHLQISDKIGDGLPAGAVFKHRSPTGEVLAPNAPGRDPIVTRILWLNGLEAGNRNAYGRCVYIHGTPDEKRLGRPVSYGCIRMRSTDVMELYAATPVGTDVSIVVGRLPSDPGAGIMGLIASAATSLRGAKL